ncbi:MAG: hypothetical protein HFI90_09470 [Clostridia bacterium]|nr:hypothetical protein [Clostridia bacterium]
MNKRHENAFRLLANELFEYAAADYQSVAKEEELRHCPPNAEDKLLELVPEEKRECALEYLEAIGAVTMLEQDFFYAHGIHDGARALFHLLLG